jgi:hypothetical protein
MFHSKAALELILSQTPVNNSKVESKVEAFFMFGLTVVDGVHIKHEEVAANVGSQLSEVSILLQRGKTDEAIQLNYELLTESVKSLIIEALASAKAA